MAALEISSGTPELGRQIPALADEPIATVPQAVRQDKSQHGSARDLVEGSSVSCEIDTGMSLNEPDIVVNIPSVLNDNVNPGCVAECRICKDVDGWLIAPCLCGGTMAKVHAHCLEEWLNRRHIPDGETPCCEVCKAPYNMRVKRELKYDRATLCTRQSLSFYLEFGVVLLCLCSLLYIFILSSSSSDNENANLTWDFRNPVFCFSLTMGAAVAGFSLFTLWKMYRQWKDQMSRTIMLFEDRVDDAGSSAATTSTAPRE